MVETLIKKQDKAFTYFGDFKAESNAGVTRIKGYASTFNTDRGGDKISPKAFDSTISEFLTNPVLLINHENNTKCVLGHVEVMRIDDKGLYIEGVLTEAEDNKSDVQKIREGHLKAFSIGGHWMYNPNGPDENGIYEIVQVRLYEISVVAVPMNGEALFAVKSFSDLEASIKNGMDRNQAVKMLESINASQVMREEEKRKAIELLDPIINPVKTKTQGVAHMSDNEKALKEAQEKAAALEKENAEIRAKDAQKILGLDEVKALLGAGFAEFAKSLAGEMKTLVLNVQDRTTKKYEMPIVVDGKVKTFIGTYKTKDELTKTDKQLLDVLLSRKQMSTTGSATGAEFIPVELASELIDMMRIPETLPSIFFDIPMPTSVYPLPINASNPTWKKAAENATDTGARYTASNIGTGKVTLTAVKMTCRVPATEEFSEDSIIPIIDWFKAMIAASAVEAMSSAILDGDVSASHQDSDVDEATDVRANWSGLRFMALAVAGLKADLSTFSLATVRSLRKKMGKFGLNPNQLAWIAGPSVYNQLQNLKELNTTPNAVTIVNGVMTAVDGIQIVTSGMVREDLNASGVYDNSTKTKTYLQLVNKTRFLIGTKREMTVKVKEDMDDEVAVIASVRKAFSAVQTPAAAVQSTTIGYNITSA